MKIDPKYFNRFLAIMAIMAAVIIMFFTFHNQLSDKSDFKKRIFAQDSLQTIYFHNAQDADSLRISDFKGQYVVLDFWANWSDESLDFHQKLADIKNQYPDKLQIIAAAVGLRRKQVISYMQKHPFPFHFVGGSKPFAVFGVPGLPAQLIYNPDGKLQSVFLGFPDKSQYDSLRTLVAHGNEQ
ncbi:MAG TPA: TlpA disulfide reductase family protein [Balneolaceae bacterium]|nr:TlpA disulfide reductase family protein [Balneolaceae bacterium]